MSDNLKVGLLAAGAAIIGGLFGGLLSGAYQHLRDWFARPRLEIEFEKNDPPNVMHAAWKEGRNDQATEFVIVRPGIRNVGKRPAINCRVFLVALLEVHNSKVTMAELHDSRPLPWAGWKFEPMTIPPPKDITLYTDLVKVRKDSPGWDFTFEHKRYSDEKLKGFRGIYRFRIVATAENAKPVYREIDVEYRGEWHNLRAWKHK